MHSSNHSSRAKIGSGATRMKPWSNRMYNFLKKIPLFADLSQKDLESLCELVTEIELPAGEILVHEGSLGDRAFVIKQGQLEILQNLRGE